MMIQTEKKKGEVWKFRLQYKRKALEQNDTSDRFPSLLSHFRLGTLSTKLRSEYGIMEAEAGAYNSSGRLTPGH